MGTRTDGEIVRAVLAGDTEQYAELVRHYRDRYARFAARMLGSADEAEDADDAKEEVRPPAPAKIVRDDADDDEDDDKAADPAREEPVKTSREGSKPLPATPAEPADKKRQRSLTDF